jgi:hypothetical protein
VTRLVAAALLALLLTQLGGCAGTSVGVSAAYPDGYWDGPVYDYDFGYFYGPPVIYGGWGPGYYVGPPRWDGHPHGWGGYPHGAPHGDGHGPAFHPAPPSRPLPSVPSAPRGPGMRGMPR